MYISDFKERYFECCTWLQKKKIPWKQREVSSLNAWWTRLFKTVGLPKSLLPTQQRELMSENGTSVLLKTLPLVDNTATVARGRACTESPHIPSSPFSLRCCEFLWTSLEQQWSLAGMSFIRKSKPLKHPVMSWHLQESWLDKNLWVDLNLGKRKNKTLDKISATLVRNLDPICQMKRKVLRTAYSEVSAQARGKQQLQLSKREAFGLASDSFL